MQQSDKEYRVSRAGLEQTFRTRLFAYAQQAFATQLMAGVVTRQELEDDVERYFQSKRTGLQSIYSYYAEQWSVFHHIFSVDEAHFLQELARTEKAFSRSYSPYELNVAYYISQFRPLAAGSSRWLQTKEIFRQRWMNCLLAREVHYQQQHVDKLCQDYYLSLQERVGKLENIGRSGEGEACRLSWLQVGQSPQMKQQLQKLLPLVLHSPLVRQLQQLLGRENKQQQLRRRAVADRFSRQLVRMSAPSDVSGVVWGNNLNSLMPTEKAFLADENLYPVFLKRYVEHALQLFDSHSMVRNAVRSSSEKGADCSDFPGEGPFVVCVDTSGSMHGMPEKLAKAIVLSLALLAERKHRRCCVVLFSDQTEWIEFENLYEGLPLLSDFLCSSFHGGTDCTPALQDAISMLAQADYASADLLVLSDFDMQNPCDTYLRQLEEVHNRGVGLYAVCFANSSSHFLCQLADRVLFSP